MGGSSFTNAGTINAAANSTVNLQIANPFSNLAGGILTGGTYDVTGTLLIPGNITTNDAKIKLSGKTSQILNSNTSASALVGFVTNAPRATLLSPAIGYTPRRARSPTRDRSPSRKAAPSRWTGVDRILRRAATQQSTASLPPPAVVRSRFPKARSTAAEEMSRPTSPRLEQ